MGCLAAFLTAFYSWRLLIMAFHGKPRASADVMSHVHESPVGYDSAVIGIGDWGDFLWLAGI